jgi:hypothetical protein
MRHLRLALLPVAVLPLVLLAAATPGSAAALSRVTAPVPVGEADTSFFATYEEPCGASLMAVRTTPDGPATLVRPTGDQRPAARLRYETLLEGRFLVEGHLTGRIVEDAECGAIPELAVRSFAPWGEVRRVFSAGALDGQVHVWTNGRPRDRYVPEDFVDGPEGLLLDSEACVERPPAGCADGTYAQTDVAGPALCCPAL